MSEDVSIEIDDVEFRAQKAAQAFTALVEIADIAEDAIMRIAGGKTYADDPWGIALDAIEKIKTIRGK